MESLLDSLGLAGLGRREWTLLEAGGCVLLSVLLTIQLIAKHLRHWSNPKEQRAIIIIALMAPLYGIVSLVGLIEIRGSTAFFSFLEALKECYEALVIAKFLALMYSFLNISMSKSIVPDGIKGRPIHVSFPMTLFVPHTMHLNQRVLKLLKWWTWQFVIIRPVFSALMITLQVLGVYKGITSTIVTIVLNVSVSLALYALVLFYHAFAKELAPHSPLAKFMCVKGIVFFSFWQGIVLEILVAVGIIRSHHIWLEVDQIEEAIQNLLICVEMVLFAFMQQYAYDAAPYAVKAKKVQKKED
ncbi:hypothetical protein GOP47_0000030 [Adiantum capillus-veneris]|uniref:Uncharacterized protein n=1 Tax=Adiantum capillus-veneris TaxID=13818 RepID=A0A9D4ZS04_ADICA|nr:hypothetical protein GOP47_0000030 [Adiantum capillus-veneris]